MKNILLLENDRYCANRLIRQLKEINPDARIYEPITSVKNGIGFFTGHPEVYPALPDSGGVDIVFADLFLPDGLSFEALKYVKASIPVIFTTNFDDYAIQTFRYNDFEYLLKPIETDYLSKALNHLSGLGRNYTQGFMYHFFEQLRKYDFQYRQRFRMTYPDGYRFVWVNEVSHITTERGINRIWLTDGSDFTISLTSRDLDEQLSPEQFFRVDTKCIVNLDRIAFLENHSRNSCSIKLRDYPRLNFLIDKVSSKRLKVFLDR
ncbi:LytR/AlgR family response regulator transcription factor [Parabacteroides distasonis]|uniref:LytR/AlgR family response regulator transcription factor n=1 Tax=Parabacteroides distasonis TaxID=823 RepID=UPI001C3D5E41|nr:LytTR family DNA-binding domain-containing protein [Parabacteroides distasonis]MCR1851944.1 LytTR family DNA-binding domain-containing protein [Parabacteroides distasonis]